MVNTSLSIIVLTFNTRDLLAECLDQFYPHFLLPKARIIVVDNGSTDGSSDMVRTRYPSIELISSSQNLGYAGGNNLGLRRATGEAVILLNSDVRVSADTLTALASKLLAESDIGAISPGLLTAEMKGQVFAYGNDPTLGYLLKRGYRTLLRRGPLHNWDVDQPLDVDWVSGACMCVRRDVIEKVGLLDEHFFLYFEDVDWCLRMRQAGWRIVYDPRLKVIHFGGASQPNRKRTNRTYYQSMLTYYRKHYTPLATLALRLLLPFYIKLLN